MNFDFNHWSSYQKVNRLFATVILEILQPNDLVWVQDYHLMLLPQMLKAQMPSTFEVKLGFFLHTPFPSSEIYRVLPVRKEILQGVLGCDLVGFHTYDYARHFLSSCTRILGWNTMPNGVETAENRVVTVGTYPIGIDPEKFIKVPTLPIREVYSLEIGIRKYRYKNSHSRFTQKV